MKKTACILLAALSIGMIPSISAFAEEEMNTELTDIEEIEEIYDQEPNISSEITAGGLSGEPSVVNKEAGIQEEMILTDGSVEETMESSEQTMKLNAVTTEELEADFVRKAFGSDDATVTYKPKDFVLVCGGYGVLFVEYETDGEIARPVSAYKWTTSDKWYSVNADGSSIILEAGIYYFYGNTEWKIGSNGSGYGGYVVENGEWSYYLGVSDVTNGYTAGAGDDGDLPRELYHGAKWSDPDVSYVKGGLHNYAGNKYYMLRDGSVLRNGTMKVGDTWYEFAEDGSCKQSYKNNYWKQERLGYFVRVDESGRIIRTAGSMISTEILTSCVETVDAEFRDGLHGRVEGTTLIQRLECR